LWDYFSWKVSVDKSANSRYGVIWDMDGVIIDSVPFHYQAWQAVFKKRGKSLEKSISEKPFGHIDTIRSVMGQDISDAELGTIATEKEAVFRHLIRQRVQPLPGVIPLLAELRQRGFKLALASSAPKENINLILEGLHARVYFDAVVSAEDVTHTKPDPEVFALAAKRLGLSNSECIVVEDMPAGIVAAKQLCMRSIGVATNRPKELLAEADLVVGSMKEVTTMDFWKLLGLEHAILE
jgi:beta-phosphoglucomutase